MDESRRARKVELGLRLVAGYEADHGPIPPEALSAVDLRWLEEQWLADDDDDRASRTRNTSEVEGRGFVFAALPEAVTMTFHRVCGARLGDDGWCGRCHTTPDASEYVKARYRLDVVE